MKRMIFFLWLFTNVCLAQNDNRSDNASAVLKSTLDNWCFQYKYDGRKRMTHKKTPGADWIYMVYDDRDRVVMTQDGQQRKGNRWSFIRYDVLNRPIMTGIYIHNDTLGHLGMTSKVGTSKFYESFDVRAMPFMYTDSVMPPSVFPGEFDVLTITYYDNYDFLAGDKYFEYKKGRLKRQMASAFATVKGKITGVWTKVPGAGEQWLRTVNYYDDRYRLIQSISDDHRGGQNILTNVYDFVGRVTDSKSEVIDHGGLETIARNTDAWIEFTCTDASSNFSGFSAGLSATPEFGVRKTGSFVQVVEAGVLKGPVVPAATGDVIRVERRALTMYYRRNNILFYSTTLRTRPALTAVAASGMINVKTSFEGDARSVRKHFEYDHAGRLLNTWHSVDDRDSILLVSNEYNELGQLIDKKLHSTDDIRFEQSIDYRYNIRGWLTSVNGAELEQNVKNNDSGQYKKDFFGMDLLYNDVNSSIGNVQMFNGNISAMRWNVSGPADTTQWAYRFEYDNMSRLHSATSLVYNGQWRNANAFHESGVTYDLNGNIRTLLRTDAEGTIIDSLKYDYGFNSSRSNMLLSVKDAGTAAGFSDSVAATNDYTYDSNGNLTSDLNKQIISISYNHLNLPEIVMKSSGDHIVYTYDARGRKLSQDVYDSAHVLVKRSDYNGDWFYENDTLKFVNHEEGRVMMTRLKPEYQYHLKDHLGNVRVTFTTKDETEEALATFENANEAAEESQFVYYSEAVKVNSPLFDHTNETSTAGNQTILSNDFIANSAYCQSQGAVRISVVNGRLYARNAKRNNTVLVAVPTETGRTYRVSCDVDLAGGVKMRAYAQDQSSVPFKKLSTTTITSNKRITYTFLAYATTTYVIFEHYLSGIRDFYLDNLLIERISLGGSYSQRLNGSENERIGLAKSLSVMPGDRLKATVYVKYLDPDRNHWTASVKTMVDLIAGNMAPPATLVDGGLPGSTGGAVFPMSDVIDKGEEVGVAPKAYLNWLFFDRKMRLKNFGFERVSRSAREYGQDGPHQRLEVSVPIKEAGYVYLYLSNDTRALGGPTIEVYFDDFAVKHMKSRLIQSQDYYPFGLVFNNYTREGIIGNRWKFQGQEHIDELGLNWDSFKWRNHQPDIGRFFNIDPLSEKYVHNSPYAFSENHVVAHVELEGLESKSIKALQRNPVGLVSFNSTVKRSGQNIQVSSLNKSTDVFHTSKIMVQNDVNPNSISDHTAKVVGENMARSENSSSTVTSSIRNAHEQAEVMYKNAETYGVEHEYDLYGSGGDLIVDAYVGAKRVLDAMQIVGLPVGDPAVIIKSTMEGAINLVGLTGVTNHGGDQQILNVIDISVKAIKNPIQFHMALQNDPNVKRVLSPYSPKPDPAFHVEIPQNQK